MVNLDPWGSSQIKDYEKMRSEFGIDSMESILDGNLMSERNLIIGQRDFRRVKRSIDRGEKFCAMTGLMPSGQMHLGSKAVIEQMIYFQRLGGQISISVADMESLATRNISLPKAREIAIENFLLNYIAMGLKKCNFYFQSEDSKIQKLAFIVGKNVNISELKSIYGFEDTKKLLEINSPLIQVADILGPQIYGNPMPTVVPVGADQDPHIRLTRDLSTRMNIIHATLTDNGVKFSVGGTEDAKEYFKSIKKALKNYTVSKISENLPYRTLEVEGKFEDIYGIEQEISIRERNLNPYSTLPPSSIILRLETGIRGGKMSKSVPESTISLNEDPKESEKKIKKALTGGRESIEEQKKLGGNPYCCPVFELYLYHLAKDKKHLDEVEIDCKSGVRMCGNCKAEAGSLMSEFLKELKEKREASRHLIPEFLEK